MLRQSKTPAVYEQALETLQATTHVYACECSRTDIGGERYDGRCRGRGLEMAPGRGIRVQLAMDRKTSKTVLRSAIRVPAEQCGDLLVKDRDGRWTWLP